MTLDEIIAAINALPGPSLATKQAAEAWCRLIFQGDHSFPVEVSDAGTAVLLIQVSGEKTTVQMNFVDTTPRTNG